MPNRFEVVMRFILIDKIIDLQLGTSIRAVKNLSLAEEYLKDHFPRFPVMPGVLMIEAMYQASTWLIYASEDFANPAVVLKEARNVRYGDFVQPGQTLTVTAEILKQDQATFSLKTVGMIGERTAVSAKLVVERFKLGDRFPERSATDFYLRRRLKEVFALLYSPPASPAA